MSEQFLDAVRDGDESYVSDNVGDMTTKTLNKALTTIKMVMKNFKDEDSDYSDTIDRLKAIESIIRGAL